MKTINKKEFTKVELDKNVKAFIIYKTFFNLNLMSIHPAHKVRISLLVAKKVKIAHKYLDFLNIFLKEKTLILLKAIKLN